ncbi:mammalian cell entry protein [Mycolicibacterium sp. J2]|uniref:mammalian cell entry protein n=1 Tax=Mycolicibacterium sp. J2 TaxID=2993511 RepID=UPI00224A7227|nr:mammalian cell entry protein [Mycolicibacterium sp. J2]MCX2713014.1 mammalian cell entry protein [Mycolicibacterium sp. J2]
MEDQPADPGDLTTGSPDEQAEAQPTGKAARGAVAAAESDSTPTDPQAEPEAAAAEPVLVAHRTAGRPLKIAAVVAAVLFVAAGAFAGSTAARYLSDRALVHTKMEIARTATDAITTLWTYTPEDMESLPDRAEKYLGGDFAAQYRQYIDAIVAPNKQAQVSNSTQVLGAAIETISPEQATALVYTNSVATSPVTKNIPSLRYLSYRLTLERRNSTWLITEMTPVTSLDLTPRL